MKLSAIVAAFQDTPPAWLMLGDVDLARALKKAVRFYCGFGSLERHPDITGDHLDATASLDGAQDLDITDGELALIRPLFDLYAEHDQAMMIEASRGMGQDVFGRTVSEVQQDIAVREEALPRLAFFFPVETV